MLFGFRVNAKNQGKLYANDNKITIATTWSVRFLPGSPSFLFLDVNCVSMAIYLSYAITMVMYIEQNIAIWRRGMRINKIYAWCSPKEHRSPPTMCFLNESLRPQMRKIMSNIVRHISSWLKNILFIFLSAKTTIPPTFTKSARIPRNPETTFCTHHPCCIWNSFCSSVKSLWQKIQWKFISK